METLCQTSLCSGTRRSSDEAGKPSPRAPGYAAGWRLGWYAGLITLIACIAMLGSSNAGASGEFRRGVNLSHWFELEGRTPVSVDDMITLRRIGFDHVRIPVDPARLGWHPPGPPQALQLAGLLQAIEQALGAGLDVIVDVSPDGATRQSIETDNAVFESYADFLQVLAKAITRFPGNRVALELLNEPQFYGLRGGRWQDRQARLIERVRSTAPDLTLIAMGRMGGSLDGLAALTPYPDPKVIYSFHFYLPYIFTHQGAPWVDPGGGTTAALFRHVLYPSALVRGSPPSIRVSTFDQRARDELGRYIQANWDSRKIDDELLSARRMAHDRHIRIICDEFGVIRSGVDPQSRDRWLHDVRKALETSGIGWTVWDYADDFGIASRNASSGQREIDPATLEALGLKGDQR